MQDINNRNKWGRREETLYLLFNFSVNPKLLKNNNNNKNTGIGGGEAINFFFFF